MGIRPLPPDDPAEDPEQRANRIRSFYKEYFDESKHAHGHGPVYTEEDYYDEDEYDYYEEGQVTYDAVAGDYMDAPVPYYSQPLGRRAMTPPPRGPPRFSGRSQQHMYYGMPGPQHRGPRAFSSASGRYNGPGRAMPPKPAPKPRDLQNLPTPHLLGKDDTFTPIDFAPPNRFREKRAGTPDSFRREARPYSPAVRAHIPLASSFRRSFCHAKPVSFSV